MCLASCYIDCYRKKNAFFTIFLGRDIQHAILVRKINCRFYILTVKLWAKSKFFFLWWTRLDWSINLTASTRIKNVWWIRSLTKCQPWDCFYKLRKKYNCTLHNRQPYHWHSVSLNKTCDLFSQSYWKIEHHWLHKLHHKMKWNFTKYSTLPCSIYDGYYMETTTKIAIHSPWVSSVNEVRRMTRELIRAAIA